MALFLVSLLFVYTTWWMFSSQFRNLLYAEWSNKPFTTWEHLRTVIPHILKQLSSQNAVAQGFVDMELHLLTKRRSLMLLSFQRLAVVFPFLILSGVLEIKVFIALILVATLLLGFFFRKPIRWVQIAFLAGAFFMAYQWSFYQASHWIFSPETSDFIYILTDARFFTVLVFLIAGLILTVVFRFEYWSLWLTSILFFAGGLAYLNFIAMILGEAMGWSLFWYWQSRGTSQRNQIVQREILFITCISAFIFLGVIIKMKSMGYLDIRIMGQILDKKISFIMSMLIWEFFLSIFISTWGHLRAKSQIIEPSNLESLRLPVSVFGQGLLKYTGWLEAQKQYRLTEIKRRLESLEKSQQNLSVSGSGSFPKSLMEKSRLEVESLKGLLGALT